MTVANRWVEQGVEVTVVSEGEQIDRLDPRIEHVDGPYDEVRATLPTAAIQLRGVIQRTRPDCIITNSLATALVARASLATRQIPIVNVGHGWPAERYARVARPMAVVDRVVAVSPDVRNRLVTAGLAPSQIVVVHNGIDCRPFVPPEPTIRTQIRAELGAGDPTHILVVTVGRLEPQKAHQHIFEMAVRLRDSHPHVRFALVGTGSREAELHALVENLGVGDRVHLAGKRTDIPHILGAADIYLNCSDWEGMPLSTIEGMAAGLPAVVTRTEGAAQLFTPDTGLVVPVGDVPALSDAVATLADDADRREAMGRAARTRARSQFSHTRMVDQLMAVQSVTRP